jgi:predicted transcriptional regulator/DNA-binding XRE family transcriptional regulator
LRRASGLTQAAMAEMLEISPSYLNLIEKNQRPLTATVMLRLAERFDFDTRALVVAEPGGGAEAIRRRLADPMFADLEIDRDEVAEWMSAAPGGAEAFARAFDRMHETGAGSGDKQEEDAVSAARGEIERWRNHFADLDMQAETLADELRLGDGDLYGAILERLRVRYQITVRILPVDVMPGILRRLDMHARQLQLSEMLDPASRTFQAAYQLGLLEAKAEMDGLVTGARLTERSAQRLFHRHIASYFAAALMMPYGRFLRACDQTGYDFNLLQRRFNAGFEMVAHRLTTLQRVGARGLPFFMIRVDRAGMVSKRYAGASNAPLLGAGGRCALWGIHYVFDRPGELVRQLVELEDGTRWFTLARTVQPQHRSAEGVTATFSVGLGVGAEHAGALVGAHGIDLKGAAVPIGLGCRNCLRAQCPQRAVPPNGRMLMLNERERGLSPFPFAGD